MSPCILSADYYITKTSLFCRETALLGATLNSTKMSHMFLARTYTHSSVSSWRFSLAVTGGIVLLRPDLNSQHAQFPLEVVIDGNQTKTHQNTPIAAASNASCSGFLESDVV